MEEKLSLFWRSYRQSPDGRHVDVLDGVRVICVLLVSWYHIWQQSWLSPAFVWNGKWISLDFLLRSGYMWVDGLLLLSGFLLYLPYAQAGEKLPGIVPFYKRRLIRILPSYLLCVIPSFIFAWIQGKYGSVQQAALDLGAHLLFIHNLFPKTYFSSPINGVLWTLAVEMQFYVLFPFLARAYRRHPLITWCLMTGGAFAFRLYASGKPDTSIFVNQLPAFLDVYANGFLAASMFTALKKKLGNEPDKSIRLLFTALLVICALLTVRLLQDQAASSGYEGIRHGQMDRRFLFSAVLSCFMLCAAFSLSGLRFLLGNPLMGFLSSVSFQFYIYHQMLAVQLKAWHFPPSEMETPWSQGDFRWQLSYTLCCFLLALILSALITYLFEKPVARWLRRKTRAEH